MKPTLSMRRRSRSHDSWTSLLWVCKPIMKVGSFCRCVLSGISRSRFMSWVAMYLSILKIDIHESRPRGCACSSSAWNWWVFPNLCEQLDRVTSIAVICQVWWILSKVLCCRCRTTTLKFSVGPRDLQRNGFIGLYCQWYSSFWAIAEKLFGHHKITIIQFLSRFTMVSVLDYPRWPSFTRSSR